MARLLVTAGDILNNQFASVFTSESLGDLSDLGDSPYKRIENLVISNDGAGVVKQFKKISKQTKSRVQTRYHYGF